MKTFTRRKFLRSVLCGVGLSVTGIQLSSLFAIPLSAGKAKQADDSLSVQFENARNFFYKKNYIEAERLYEEILTTIPAHISIYDCYKKVLAHQNRIPEIIPYYKKAIEKYPDRVDFYDRLAITYREIVTGNKKQEKSLCQQEGEDDLLKLAVGVHRQAIQIRPEKKFLYLSLLDTLYARNVPRKKGGRQIRNVSFTTGLPSLSDQEKQLLDPYLPEWYYRKYPESANPKTKIVSGNSISKIQAQVFKIENKVRRPLYTTLEMESRAKEIKLVTKKLNVQLHQILYAKNDFPAMTALAIDVLHNNPDETQLLGTTRKFLKKAGRWDLQRKIYEERTKNYKDFWTQYGLSNAYIHTGSIDMALTTLKKMSVSTQHRTGKKVDMVYRGLCDCMLAKNNIEAAKAELIKGMNATCGLGGTATSLLLKYAQCLCTQGKSRTAIELLRKKLDSSYRTDLSDPILVYIAPDISTSPELFYLHQFYNKDKTVHTEEKVSILCAIAKIQKNNSDWSGVEQTCGEIQALIPSHPFIKKIKSST